MFLFHHEFCVADVALTVGVRIGHPPLADVSTVNTNPTDHPHHRKGMLDQQLASLRFSAPAQAELYLPFFFYPDCY